MHQIKKYKCTNKPGHFSMFICDHRAKKMFIEEMSKYNYVVMMKILLYAKDGHPIRLLLLYLLLNLSPKHR